jgi:hypothetical protein
VFILFEKTRIFLLKVIFFLSSLEKGGVTVSFRTGSILFYSILRLLCRIFPLKDFTKENIISKKFVYWRGGGAGGDELHYVGGKDGNLGLLARTLGYSDFHNLMGFTSKKMPNNIL